MHLLYPLGLWILTGDPFTKIKDYGRPCKRGDTVEMILDLENLELKYKINNEQKTQMLRGTF